MPSLIRSIMSAEMGRCATYKKHNSKILVSNIQPSYRIWIVDHFVIMHAFWL